MKGDSRRDTYAEGNGGPIAGMRPGSGGNQKQRSRPDEFESIDDHLPTMRAETLSRYRCPRRSDWPSAGRGPFRSSFYWNVFSGCTVRRMATSVVPSKTSST